MSQTPPDHIGWTLWRATAVWRKDFVAGMVAAGHTWFAQARGNLMVHIGPNGLRQGDLAERASLTKQAVQQFVDELVADGIVVRTPDETDARARWIRLTPSGEAAMRDADRIKAEIEARWRERLGSEDFEKLDALLRRVVSDVPDAG
ncbi:MarR family winged helix-turn-helix transcriptional regulator [Tabrizicola sp.]|uniref:MarR family winged helix-turn-helix transcriptional regulator n=1 Tax=Tabrizicola sp. TaxID=2005166 RepID=UPI003F34E5E6